MGLSPCFGLDKRIGITTIGKYSLMLALCKHSRTELIARRDGVEYVRCLECGNIFEADDLDFVSVPEEEEGDDSEPV
jgi:hypothetical protein